MFIAHIGKNRAGSIEKWLLYYMITSHASIAYRKRLPPQRAVGTIGSVWQESTPSKEATGPAQNSTPEMPNGAARP